MPKPFDFGDVNLTAGGESSGSRPLPETHFCIAILGDFSGRENRKLAEPSTIGARRAILVDRDNFDEVLSKLAPALALPIGEGGSLHLRFRDLDDFHPDRVFESLEAFGKLRKLRLGLQDPSTFKDAADELGLHSSPTASLKTDTANSTPAPPRASQLSAGGLLDEMVEQTESRAAADRPRRAPDEVHEFARRVAAQHLVNTPDPRQPEILAVMDRAIGGLMRAVLHSPDFQGLEAAWRAVFLLVRRLETDSQLKLYLFDISKEEMASDLRSTTGLRKTGTYRLLVENSVGTPGADPWAIVVGNFTFGPEDADIKLLARIAEVAHSAGAPFLAQASPQLLGCASLAATPSPRDWKPSQDRAGWSELRHLSAAEAIGLALPRFLLRLPYGEKTSPLESFDFEESSDLPPHEDYLWGNPAFALALMLGQAFSQSGWEMRPGEFSELDGLPLHVYGGDGVADIKPCAEVLLTEEGVERILSEGLMPLVSFKGSDRVRLASFRSIADPARPLAGRWTK